MRIYPYIPQNLVNVSARTAKKVHAWFERHRGVFVVFVRLKLLRVAVCLVTALHVMQTRYCDEISVCPSVRPSVCLSDA